MATRRELEQTRFLYGGNSSFIEELYARYLADPASVEPSWRAYFDALEPENRVLFERARAALAPRPRELRPAPANLPNVPTASLDDAATKALLREHLRVIMLIRAYRVRGHLLANLDPLGLARRNDHYPELDYKSYGFTDADLDREFYLDYVLGLEKATLRQIMEILRKTYCRHDRRRVHAHPGPGAEGLDPGADRGYGRPARLRRPRTSANPGAADRRRGLRAVPAHQVPGHQALLARRRRELDPAARDDPPQRGAASASRRSSSAWRTAAASTCSPTCWASPTRRSSSEFEGGSDSASDVLGSGDVKYHLGFSTDRDLPDGPDVHLSLAPTPRTWRW